MSTRHTPSACTAETSLISVTEQSTTTNECYSARQTATNHYADHATRRPSLPNNNPNLLILLTLYSLLFIPSYIDIILPLAIADTYTYSVPDSITTLPIGGRVLVPLGKNKTITGIIYRPHQGEIDSSITVRDILQVLDDTPIVTAQQIQLWEWIAQYYMCTLGEVLTAALPAGIIDDDYTQLTAHYVTIAPAYTQQPAQQSLIDTLHRAPKREHLFLTFLSLSTSDYTTYKPVERRLLLETSHASTAVLHSLIDKHILIDLEQTVSRLRQYDGVTTPIHTLDTQQQQALSAILHSWQQHDVTLLYGVTSSGKTEVYMHLIAQALQQGKQVLYLVPEIALTTQLTDRLQSVFGSQVVVYHSRFSNPERVEIYYQVAHATTPLLIIGARSAVFLPFQQLGLIIVDEEHEPSYKQQDPAPRYHARSVATILARLFHAKVLLGTATPSIESYHNTQTGKYGLVTMTKRYQQLQLPRITIIDLQRQYHRKEMYRHFADPLVERIRQELTRNKQVILFQNRRGYAPFLQCPACGYVPHCPNCDVSLTYHKRTQTLVCHSCGYHTNATSYCTQCHTAYHEHGFGTERLEEEIQLLFPNARVARMDLDTTRNKDSYQRLIDDFTNHQVDILIGTQMVTKGLHFNEVSLVAVLQADTLINQPNFRSYERAFQMLEQVSGRAGRTGQQGEVIIQTFDPSNPIYTLLQQHDFLTLYQQQIQERQQFHYPPFYRLIILTLKHHNIERLNAAAQLLQQRLTQTFGTRCSVIITPAIARAQNMHILQIRLTIETQSNISVAKRLLQEHITFVQHHPACKGTIILPDIDPQ